jgi:hypothetical protein
MKPCVCGGSNSQCRYCSGSGYVTDGRGLPLKHTNRETFSAGPLNETTTTPLVIPPKRSRPPSEQLIDLAWCVLFLLITLFIAWLVKK